MQLQPIYIQSNNKVWIFYFKNIYLCTSTENRFQKLILHLFFWQKAIKNKVKEKTTIRDVSLRATSDFHHMTFLLN